MCISVHNFSRCSSNPNLLVSFSLSLFHYRQIILNARLVVVVNDFTRIVRSINSLSLPSPPSIFCFLHLLHPRRLYIVIAPTLVFDGSRVVTFLNKPMIFHPPPSRVLSIVYTPYVASIIWSVARVCRRPAATPLRLIFFRLITSSILMPSPSLQAVSRCHQHPLQPICCLFSLLLPPPCIPLSATFNPLRSRTWRLHLPLISSAHTRSTWLYFSVCNQSASSRSPINPRPSTASSPSPNPAPTTTNASSSTLVPPTAASSRLLVSASHLPSS